MIESNPTETETVPEVQRIEAWLIVRVAEIVGANPDDIDPQRPTSQYGLGSRDGLQLSGDLETWLDRKLAPTLAWEYPTIRELAKFLAGEEVESQLAEEWDQDPGW